MTAPAAAVDFHGGLMLTQALFPHSIAVAASDPRAAHYQALPQEIAALPKSAPKRLRAFAAGRTAAHEAMTALGHPTRPILPGPDRAPIWPKGLVGSISHSETCCLAALGSSDAFQSIAVDVEENTPLDADLFTTVCTATEQAWLATFEKSKAAHLAKLIFSAKECAYKCQYPLTKTLFGFDVLRLTFDLDSHQFEAMFTQTVGRFEAGDTLSGRFGLNADLIVTAMSIKI